MSPLFSNGLGRRVAPDPRDRRFAMRAMLDATPPPPRASRYYRAGPVLDQGATSACVGFAWAQWLASAPLMTRAGPAPLDIYAEARRVDEWPGEDYDGTSVRAGVKALQARGHVAEYRWAAGTDDVLDWLLGGHGSVVMGSAWYAGMFTPDQEGFIRPGGAVVGGHAYVLIGANRAAEKVRLLNSWGPAWGRRGRAWLRLADVARLLAEDGEACCGVEVANG